MSGYVSAKSTSKVFFNIVTLAVNLAASNLYSKLDKSWPPDLGIHVNTKHKTVFCFCQYWGHDISDTMCFKGGEKSTLKVGHVRCST